MRHRSDELRDSTCNTSWTMLGVGHVVFYVFTSTVPRFPAYFGKPRRGRRLVRIWPSPADVDWSKARVIDDVALLQLSGALVDKLREPNVISKEIAIKYVRYVRAQISAGRDLADQRTVVELLRAQGGDVASDGELRDWSGDRRAAERLVRNSGRRWRLR